MPKTLQEDRKIKWLLLVAILIYSTVALFIVFNLGETMYLGSFEKYDNDDVKYIRSGAVLSEKGVLTYENPKENTVFIMSGLSYILAFFFKLFGQQKGIVCFRVFQVYLQTMSLYLIFLIGKRAFNTKTAFLACILDAIYIPELFSINLILMECIFKFLLLLLCYIGIIAVEQRSAKHYLMAGSIWALACYFRPTVALLPLLVLVLWIRCKYKLYEMMKYGMLTALVFLLLMSPWWIRNYQLYHDFIPFTLSSGNPFLQGTYIDYDQSKDFISYEASQDYIERNQQEHNIGLERLRKFGSKYPIRYIYWYTIGKSTYFWGSPFYWKELPGIRLILVQIYHHIMLLMALVGLFRIKQRNVAISLMLYLIIYLNLIYLPFYTFSRYSYPIMGYVIVFASHGVREILKSSKRSEVAL